MLAGNIASALQSFDASTRTFYQAVFSGLGSNLVKIIDLMREVSLVTFGHSYGEVLLTRNRPDGVYAYPVQISRDEKGIWRLSGL